MENSIFVGAGFVTYLLRHARTLKDKRQVTQSVVQRLKNEGFSVVEIGFRDEAQRGILGFSLVARSASYLDDRFDFALNLFNEEFEIVDKKKEVRELLGT